MGSPVGQGCDSGPLAQHGWAVGRVLDPPALHAEGSGDGERAGRRHGALATRGGGNGGRGQARNSRSPRPHPAGCRGRHRLTALADAGLAGHPGIAVGHAGGTTLVAGENVADAVVEPGERVVEWQRGVAAKARDVRNAMSLGHAHHDLGAGPAVGGRANARQAKKEASSRAACLMATACVAAAISCCRRH